MPDANKVYQIDQLIDKQLIAIKQVKVYASNKTLKRIVNIGQLVGKIYSWVTWQGTIYFMLYGNEYVEAKQGNFDVNFIINQGAQSIVEQSSTKNNNQKIWQVLALIPILYLIIHLINLRSSKWRNGRD